MGIRTEIGDVSTKLELARQTVHIAGPAIPFENDVANVFRKATGSQSPQLARELQATWSRLEGWKRPDKAVFCPKRNHPHPDRSAIAWIQLLILVTQARGSRRAWIVPRRWYASSLEVVQKAALGAWQEYLLQYGTRTTIDHVLDALDQLLACFARSIHLDGDFLVRDGVRLKPKLSSKQRLFMKLLIDANGKLVRHADFLKKGIKRTDVLKSRLLKDEALGFLEDHIAGERGLGYRLIDL